MKWPLFLSDGSVIFYRLRPPPARPPYERPALEERPALDPIDLDAEDLLDVLGAVDLLDVDLLDVLGDVDLLDVDGLFEALLAVDAPFEVRPACDLD